MEIEISFPAPGYYGSIYGLAHKPDQRPNDPATGETSFENRPRLFLVEDGLNRNIAQADQGSQLPSVNPWNHEGYWVKPYGGYDFYGSAPFKASSDNVVLIDNVLLASASKMTEGTIPSGGGFQPGFNGLVGPPGNAEVTLSWAAVAGATGYHVYYKTRLASNFIRVTATPITATNFAVQALLNDSTYNFVVTYIDADGVKSAFSNQVDVVPSEVAVIMAWEFDDYTDKQAQAVAGLLTRRVQSPYLATGTQL